MTIKKLSKMPYAQAHVEIDENGDSYLFSYVTLVAQVEGGWFSVNGLYSATTLRHIGAYAREYANTDYQLAKQIYTDNKKFNIETGEVEDI